MTRITAEVASFTLPANAQVGDEFQISATARITGIEEDLIDTTIIGGEESYVVGDRKVSLWLTKVEAA